MLDTSQIPKGSAPSEYNGASHRQCYSLDCTLGKLGARVLNSDILRILS